MKVLQLPLEVFNDLPVNLKLLAAIVDIEPPRVTVIEIEREVIAPPAGLPPLLPQPASSMPHPAGFDLDASPQPAVPTSRWSGNGRGQFWRADRVYRLNKRVADPKRGKIEQALASRMRGISADHLTQKQLAGVIIDTLLRMKRFTDGAAVPCAAYANRLRVLGFLSLEK